METKQPSVRERREFLKKAMAGGGAVAAVAVASHAANAEPSPLDNPAALAEAPAAGYHLTDHIERYYRLARF